MAPQWAERIKLRQLRVILAVDEQGSITRAAEHLFVTQAAVSKVIAEIETLIGTNLFERRGRTITPTDAGHHVIRTARRVASELKLLGEEVDLISEGGAGLLIIGFQAISILQFMARVVATVKTRHPRITIRLVEDALPNLLRELRAGRVDLVFGRMIRGLLTPDLDGAPPGLSDGRHAVAVRGVIPGADVVLTTNAIEMSLDCRAYLRLPVRAFRRFDRRTAPGHAGTRDRNGLRHHDRDAAADHAAARPGAGQSRRGMGAQRRLRGHIAATAGATRTDRADLVRHRTTQRKRPHLPLGNHRDAARATGWQLRAAASHDIAVGHPSRRRPFHSDALATKTSP